MLDLPISCLAWDIRYYYTIILSPLPSEPDCHRAERAVQRERYLCLRRFTPVPDCHRRREAVLLASLPSQPDCHSAGRRRAARDYTWALPC